MYRLFVASCAAAARFGTKKICGAISALYRGMSYERQRWCGGGGGGVEMREEGGREADGFGIYHKDGLGGF